MMHERAHIWKEFNTYNNSHKTEVEWREERRRR
jgi:hypothetical protein